MPNLKSMPDQLSCLCHAGRMQHLPRLSATLGSQALHQPFMIACNRIPMQGRRLPRCDTSSRASKSVHHGHVYAVTSHAGGATLTALCIQALDAKIKV